jgi:exodeoxyribonuclease VII small subunit
MSKKNSPSASQLSETPSFEERFSRLEEIVGLLDRGDAPLEELLALYEEGMRLSKECGSILESAEQKISILKNGNVEEA